MQIKDCARRYLGVKEGSSLHRTILNQYNSIRPLPRNYKVKSTDSWCCVFVSLMLKLCENKHLKYECSVNKFYQLNKKYFTTKPKPNDIILFSWKSNGNLNHIGIVESVNSDGIITTIEGNHNDSVSRRKIHKSNRCIYGYIRPVTQGSTYDLDKIADEVIQGKYGNGDTRKVKLKSLGLSSTQVQEVQNLVNKKLA